MRQQFDSVALWRMKRETDSFMPIKSNNCYSLVCIFLQRWKIDNFILVRGIQAKFYVRGENGSIKLFLRQISYTVYQHDI